MTAVILRIAGLWSDLGHSEFDRRGWCFWNIPAGPSRCPGRRSNAAHFCSFRPNAAARRRCVACGKSAGISNLTAGSRRWRALVHHHQRQSRAQSNQKCPDEQLEPIDRGDVARPQIVPRCHGDIPLARGSRTITRVTLAGFPTPASLSAEYLAYHAGLASPQVTNKAHRVSLCGSVIIRFIPTLLPAPPARRL
jgi:hypothetical protein